MDKEAVLAYYENNNFLLLCLTCTIFDYFCLVFLIEARKSLQCESR